MSRISKWFHATVDDKPWWAIILAAFLTSIGSEFVKDIPEAIAWGRSFFPIEPTLFVVLKNKGAGPPMNGPTISVMDIRSSRFLPIVGTNRTTVDVKEGRAVLKVRVMAGPGYLLVLNHTDGDKTFKYSEPIEIRGDLQYPLTFEPGTWPPSNVVFNSPEKSVASVVEKAAELPPWMKYAYREIGVTEMPGKMHNPRILEYFSSPGLPRPPVQDDETNWSSAFIHWVLGQAGISGSGSLLDRSWSKWGKASDIKPGCIAVFWRDRPDGSSGHSGFVVSASEESLAILGGNQSDQVKITDLPKSRFLGCRWPS
jgi:uncharacterized protein (TIGR02594 family)